MTTTLTTLFEGWPHCKEAHEYALDVVSGKIPNCKNVIATCQRQIDDLYRDNFKFYFDVSKAERVVQFVETMPHTKGKKFVGKNLKMESWQKFFLVCVFGWVNDQGYRRFNEALLLVPRKNGKSALAAAIGNYMFSADGEPGAEVYCGATNEKQSMEVFTPAKVMVNKRPKLRERFGIEVNARNLYIPDDGSKFMPVIGNPGDGSSPHLWIVDEYHEHPTSDQVDTAVTGMGAREQPLLLIITTAGTDTGSPCYDKFKEVERIVNRVEHGSDVERIFGLMYGIDEGDDWQNREILKKANPNYGVSVRDEYLENQQKKAIRNPSDQNKFLIKHLNVWVNAKEAWLTHDIWKKCGDPNLNEEDFLHLPSIIAVDLASKRDVCSETRTYYEDKDDGRHYYVFADHFLPSTAIDGGDDNRNSDAYQKWVIEGWLNECGEMETDLQEVEDHIRDFIALGSAQELTYDQWKATHLAQRLENSTDIDIVEFRQNAQMLSPAMEEVESAVRSGRLHHNCCPVMAWMMSNVVIKWYKTDFKLPTKEKPHNKIDGVVSMIMGVGRAMYERDNNGAPQIRELD